MTAAEPQDSPSVATILEHIAVADVHQLRRINDVTIPRTPGFTDEQRAELKEAVRTRWCQLNAAMVGPQKSRW